MSVRVGLAGLGSMGQNHLRILRASPNANLVAVCDPREEARNGVGATPYARLEDMLDSEKLDAVILATPTHLHYEHVLQAVTRGIPVFVEKPLALTANEAGALWVMSSDTPITVGHIERFNPAVVALKQELHRIGNISIISTRRSGLRATRTRTTSGVATELLPHDVDVITYLLNERPFRVFASAASVSLDPALGIEDVLYGTLDFNSGTIATVQADWLSPRKVRELRVLGQNGSFELDYIHQTLSFFDTNGTETKIPITHQEPLSQEIEFFLDWVSQGAKTSPVVTAEDGFWAVDIVEALLESVRDESPVLL